MAKKTDQLNYGAADFDNDNLPGIPGEMGGMDMFNSYEELNVANTKIQLKKDAKKLIKGMCELYLADDKIQRPEYVEAIQKVEEMNLGMLLGQVKYSEHALDSIMRQLDSGGFMDKGTYEMMMQLQTNAINITMQVSRYVRTLPEYFQSLEKDITKYQSIDLIKTGDSVVTDESGEEHSMESFSSNEPFRGTKDLMKTIQNQINIVKDEAMNVEDIEEIDEDLSGVSDKIEYEIQDAADKRHMKNEQD